MFIAELAHPNFSKYNYQSLRTGIMAVRETETERDMTGRWNDQEDRVVRDTRMRQRERQRERHTIRERQRVLIRSSQRALLVLSK